MFAGFVVLNLLNFLFAMTSSAIVPAWFPASGPTIQGLALGFVGSFANAVLAGLATGRLVGRAPLAHAAVLAAVFGFTLLGSLGELRTMGAVGLGFVALPPLGCLLGGWVASRVSARA